MFIAPSIFDKKNITAAQSTRRGGVSEAPYQSLNLGMSTNDSPENVVKNRQLFLDALGTDINHVAMSGQVHGTKILPANQPVLEKGYDALVTNTSDLVLAVGIADCTPVLIYDTKNKAIAAIHAGWRGTAAGIVTKTIAAMHKNYSTQGADCLAYIGTCIGYKAFEVNHDVAQHFNSSVKKYDPIRQKHFVDLKTANKNQLMQAGIKEQNIEVSEFCTVNDNDLFFSHRKENGSTGRMMAVIKIN